METKTKTLLLLLSAAAGIILIGGIILIVLLSDDDQPTQLSASVNSTKSAVSVFSDESSSAPTLVSDNSSTVASAVVNSQKISSNGNPTASAVSPSSKEVNVVELGADNTGKMDSTAVITYAHSLKKRVYYPNGTYIFNGRTLDLSGGVRFESTKGVLVRNSISSVNILNFDDKGNLIGLMHNHLEEDENSGVDELSGSVQDYQDFFKALEQTSPVPIGFEDIEGGAHGYFHLLDNRIAIQEGMSQLQTIKTAIHEIAHAKLHAIDPNDPEQANRPDSRTREVQAESVAYTVCQHYGLDTSEYSFGYVAGWSSGRELAELKASLEIIRSAAHELISALDEHLAELRQQREADLSTAQEAAFALDNGNTLFIQTCDSGYDYTLYGPDNKALDGGQLDAPGLTLKDAGVEALNLLGQTAAVTEVLLGDKLAAFQEAAEKANEIPAPVKIPDPAAEPTVTILRSESDKLQDGEIMPLSVANRIFEELDTTQHTEREKDGYTGGWYDKTAFRIDFTLNGQPDNYEGRQDFGDGDGSLIQHIQSYHEYYAKDENWKNFVLHNKGPKAWEQDKAEREMVLTEFIPYLKQHCNLSAMEQTATAALREGQNISPEQAAYYNAVVAYVQDCRPLLNQGQYNLPEPPKLADFDQSLQDYKAQVQAEIAQEAAAAGMTVEEYAAAGFEAPQQDSFSIYQLRNEDSTRDYRFEPYDRLQAAGLTVDKANYTEVYAAPLTAGTTLEDIYRTFNVDYPADFKGHSLSVSDVVVLHQNGQDTAHYCDSVGFQQVPEFLRENPLRTAELSTEQNENMIDGVLNNAPSLGELEAKAKAGEQISLTDLAAAVKAEEKAPKAKKSRAAKPKKPSIRAQLDAAKKEQSKQTLPREKAKELEV